jgi:DNA polymerase III gamma/tau subunit
VGQLIDQLLGYFRDAMTQAVGCDETRVLYALPGQVGEIREIAAALGLETLLAAAQVLDQTAARLRVSTQGRTLAEMALVRIARLGDLQALADLVAQLEAGAPAALTPAAGRAGAPPAGDALKKNALNNAASPPPPSPASAAGGAHVPAVAPPAVASASSHRATEAQGASSAAVVAPAAAPAVAAQPPAGGAPPPGGDKAARSGQAPSGRPTLAPQDAPLDDPSATWHQAAERLSGLLAEHANAATRFAVDGNGRLIASFPESMKIARDALLRPGHAARLAEALEAAAGRPVRYALELHAEAQGASGASAAPSRRQLQAEVIQRPFVRRAMELFEADETRLKYVPPPSNN